MEAETSHTGEKKEGVLYYPKALEGKDKYTYFLGGNQPLCVIRTGREGGKLLVVRDSYSDSLAPFLSLGFSEVHLADLRYFREDLKEYIRENEITEVLVIYSFANFSSDTGVRLLGR